MTAHEALLCLALATAAIGTPQKVAATSQGDAAGGGEARPVLASDGEPVAPGRIPKGTPEKATTLWKSLVSASRSPQASIRRIDAFRLEIDATANGERVGTNQVRATYSYLSEKKPAPRDFMRLRLESGREHLRGPDGDYLVYGNGKSEKLVGRDYAQDREQLDQAIAIARNFTALTDPGNLRLTSLRALDGPPPGLAGHEIYAKAGGEKLAWLEIVTPDFGLYSKNAPFKEALIRVAIGLDPKTGRAALAVLSEANRPHGGSAMLLRLDRYFELDGLFVPRVLDVYARDHGAGALAFATKPSSELYLISGSLTEKLTPEDFRPPK